MHSEGNMARALACCMRNALLALVLAAPQIHAEEAVYIGWSQTEVGLKPTLEKIFADFQAAHPRDKLEVIGFPFGQMEQNLILRRRNDQRSDVAQLQERWLPVFVNMNALFDLNAVFGADALASRFDPDMLKLGQVKGKQVAVPFTAGAITLVANRSVLEKAGITNPPRTLDEFTAALRKVKASSKNVIPFGFSTKGVPLIQIESTIIFWAHGARFFDDKGKVTIDSPPGRAALKYLVDLVNEGLIAKGNDRFDTRKIFAKDEVAFFFEPPVIRGFMRAQGGGPAADAKVMILPVPTLKAGDTPRGVLWAHFLVMFNQGGAKGLRHGLGAQVMTAVGMDSAAQTALWRDTGQIPTLKATLSQVGKDPYIQAFLEAAKTAWWDETTVYPNGSELRQIIAEEVEAAMLGGRPVNDAIGNMARRLEVALKEVR